MNSVQLFKILLCLDTVLAGLVLGIFVFYLVKIRMRPARQSMAS